MPSSVRTRVEIRPVAGPLPTLCEEFQGYVDRQGYPVRGRPYKAAIRLHRELWDAEHGADSRKGFVIHHRCENKRCLNLEHMELVTRAWHVRHHRIWVHSSASNPTGRFLDKPAAPFESETGVDRCS